MKVARRSILIGAAFAVVVVGLGLLAVHGVHRSHPSQLPAPAPAPAPESTATPPSPAPTVAGIGAGVEVYSDLCIHAGSSDIDGLRIVVRNGEAAERRVLGQYAANGRLPPLKAAQSSQAGGRLTFRLSGTSSGESFTGVIVGGRATVRSSAPRAEPFELPASDPSDNFPLCG